MENISSIAVHYKKVISAWKKRADVQNGEALAYRKNQDPDGEFEFGDKPKNIGEGTTTTGWCVSVSQNFLLDNIFQLLLQSRGAIAKLVSIDIKEQYYGQCYTGSQNKWHTAILVKDSGLIFIIDLTCGQFGNSFVGKEIWAFETWEKTFRSPADKHSIVDFENNEMTYLPLLKSNVFIEENKNERVDMLYNFRDITTISDSEREMLSDFFMNKLQTLNKKLLIGNINDLDFKYMNRINKLLENFRFAVKDEQYFIMEFSKKEHAKNWIKKLAENNSDGGYVLPQYIVTSNSLKDACKFNDIDFNEVNIESMKNQTFLILKFKTVSAVDVSMIKNVDMFIPYGIKIMFDIESDIKNGGEEMAVDFAGIPKKTNAIIINCTM